MALLSLLLQSPPQQPTARLCHEPWRLPCFDLELLALRRQRRSGPAHGQCPLPMRLELSAQDAQTHLRMLARCPHTSQAITARWPALHSCDPHKRDIRLPLVTSKPFAIALLASPFVSSPSCCISFLLSARHQIINLPP